MKVLDYEGLKQVVGKIKGLIDKKADKADLDNNIKFNDTRNTNETPAWYMKNHANKLIKEFKSTEAIGIKDKVICDYCLLITMMGLNITNGGFPIQICFPTKKNKIYYRVGYRDDTWLSWRKLLNENDIISSLSELEDDSEHRTVTDTEKDRWNKISKVENQITSMDKDISDIKVNVSSDLMIRVKQLESGLYEDIKGNPFFITFKDLNGVKLTNGVFNEKQARLEC